MHSLSIFHAIIKIRLLSNDYVFILDTNDVEPTLMTTKKYRYQKESVIKKHEMIGLEILN